MTEEIIIDGVDVAGCKDFYKEWDNWSGKDNYRCQDFLSGMCAGNNCNYKQLKHLQQENKELKSQRDEARIAYNNLILDIISDIPFTGEIGGERNISIKDHLYQMQKALASLEEIKTVLKFYADSWVDEKIYPNLHYDNTKAKEGLSKINEVLQ